MSMSMRTILRTKRDHKHEHLCTFCGEWLQVSPEAIANAEIVVANVARLAAMLEETPQTLCHHDTRPDNQGSSALI